MQLNNSKSGIHHFHSRICSGKYMVLIAGDTAAVAAATAAGEEAANGCLIDSLTTYTENFIDPPPLFCLQLLRLILNPHKFSHFLSFILK